MFRRRKQLKVAENSKSVRPNDPLHAFKSDSQKKETGRFEVRGEIWKQAKKLLYVAAILFLVWIILESRESHIFYHS